LHRSTALRMPIYSHFLTGGPPSTAYDACTHRGREAVAPFNSRTRRTMSLIRTRIPWLRDVEDSFAERDQNGRHADAAAPAWLPELLTAVTPHLRKRVRRWIRSERWSAALGPTGVDDIADDVIQESLIYVVAHARECRAVDHERRQAWACSVARTKWFMWCRSPGTHLIARRIARPLDECLPAPDSRDLVGTDAAPTSGADVPSDVVRMLARLSATACASYSPGTVEAFRKRVEGCATWDELAADLGTSPAAARLRVVRLRTHLAVTVLRLVADLPPTERARLTAWLACRGVQLGAPAGDADSAAGSRHAARQSGRCRDGHLARSQPNGAVRSWANCDDPHAPAPRGEENAS